MDPLFGSADKLARDALSPYVKDTGAFDPAKDITLILRYALGVWGQGSNVWVADAGLTFFIAPTSHHRVFSYRLPPSTPNDVTLNSLDVSPFPSRVLLHREPAPNILFRSRFLTAWRVPNQASRVTVSATANNSHVRRWPTGMQTATHWRIADSIASGFQVDVAVGETAIAMRLAAGWIRRSPTR